MSIYADTAASQACNNAKISVIGTNQLTVLRYGYSPNAEINASNGLTGNRLTTKLPNTINIPILDIFNPLIKI